MSDSLEAERARFEAWFKERFPNEYTFVRKSNEDYRSQVVHVAWKAWLESKLHK